MLESFMIITQGLKGTQYGRRRGFKNCCSIVREQFFARPNILIEIYLHMEKCNPDL